MSYVRRAKHFHVTRRVQASPVDGAPAEARRALDCDLGDQLGVSAQRVARALRVIGWLLVVGGWARRWVASTPGVGPAILHHFRRFTLERSSDRFEAALADGRLRSARQEATFALAMKDIAARRGQARKRALVPSIAASDHPIDRVHLVSVGALPDTLERATRRCGDRCGSRRLWGSRRRLRATSGEEERASKKSKDSSADRLVERHARWIPEVATAWLPRTSPRPRTTLLRMVKEVVQKHVSRVVRELDKKKREPGKSEER